MHVPPKLPPRVLPTSHFSIKWGVIGRRFVKKINVTDWSDPQFATIIFFTNGFHGGHRRKSLLRVLRGEILGVQVRENWPCRLTCSQAVLPAATLLLHPSSASTHPLTPPLTPELNRSTTPTPLPKPRCPGEAGGRFGAEVSTAVRCRAVRGGAVCDGQTRCGGGTVRSDGKGRGTAVPRRETRRRGLGTVHTCDARS